MLDDRELLGCEGLSAVHGSEAVIGNLEIRREAPGIQPLHRFRYGRVRNGSHGSPALVSYRMASGEGKPVALRLSKHVVLAGRGRGWARMCRRLSSGRSRRSSSLTPL